MKSATDFRLDNKPIPWYSIYILGNKREDSIKKEAEAS